MKIRTKNIKLECRSFKYDEFHNMWEVTFHHVYDEKHDSVWRKFDLNNKEFEYLLNINRNRGDDEELLKILNVDLDILSIQQMEEYFYEENEDDDEFEPEKMGYELNEKIGWYEIKK